MGKYYMKKLVNEWILKAEGDFNSALRELRARKHTNYDAAGFHAQQCIEKYLKAILQFHNISFLKIHDLLTLSELCSDFFPEFSAYKKQIAYLNQFATLFRYPGESANKNQAKTAVDAMKNLRIILREKLHLCES